MSINIGTLVSAAIRPNDSLDPIASAFSNEIKGGVHGYNTILERDSLIEERRQWGMLSYVIADSKTYQLVNGYSNNNIMSNLNWKEMASSSGSNDGGSEWLNSVKSIIGMDVIPVAPLDKDRYLVIGTQTNAWVPTYFLSLESGSVVEYNATLGAWTKLEPKKGMTVRVNDKPDNKYVYSGVYPTGEWGVEKCSEVIYINPTTTDGITYTFTTNPQITSYETNMIFVTRFASTNTGGTCSLDINGLGSVYIRKVNINGSIDMNPSEIVADILYTLIFDGDNFQLSAPFSTKDNNYINYYIPAGETIIVPENEQYWVYGDLTIDGQLINYGEVIIANGGLVLGPVGNVTGSFIDYGTFRLINIGSESFVEYIEITKSELNDLITTNSLMVGAKYKISGVDVELYGGTDIIVDAITPNQISRGGSGIFKNPDYQSYYVWNNYVKLKFESISDFNLGESVSTNNGANGIFLAEGLIRYVGGDWTSASTMTGAISGTTASITNNSTQINYSIGDKVIWGGKLWESNNGTIGTSLDRYELDSNWTLISFTSSLYLTTVEDIKYDYEKDYITYRADKYGNVVEYSNVKSSPVDVQNPIKLFQWGNAEIRFVTNGFQVGKLVEGVFNNYIYNSIFDCINFINNKSKNNRIINSTFYNNIFYNSSLSDLYMENSKFSENRIVGSSNISDLYMKQSVFELNRLFDSVLRNNILDISNIRRNNFKNTSFVENKIYKSRVSDNIYKNSLVSNNKLDSNSELLLNTITFGSIVNNLLFSSSISSTLSINSIGNESSIFNNIVNTGSINNNNIQRSNISYNNLISNSKIENSTLENISSISFNTMSNSNISNFSAVLSKIENNNFSSSILNLSLTPTLTNKTISKCSFKFSEINFDITTSANIFQDTITKDIITNDNGPRIIYFDSSDSMRIESII